MAETKKTSAAKATEQVEAAVAAGKETVESVVKAGAEVATKGVEKAVAMGQEQMAAAVKAGSEAFKNYEDLVAFNKDNVDAVVAANTLFVKGMQDINKVIFKLAQDSVEENVQLTKKLFSCKSVKEAVDLQNDVVKSNYGKALDEGRKITDMTVKLAEETTKPITARVNVTVEKFSKPIAA